MYVTMATHVFAQQAVRKVVSHVSVNCSYGSGSGVRCGVSRGKRDALGEPDPGSQEWMDSVCAQLEDNPMMEQGFPFDLVGDILQEVDQHDGAGNARVYCLLTHGYWFLSVCVCVCTVR